MESMSLKALSHIRSVAVNREFKKTITAKATATPLNKKLMSRAMAACARAL